MRAAIPLAQKIVEKLGADLLVSDSTLCTVERESGWAEKGGCQAVEALGVPTLPWWGASFSSKAFERACWRLWCSHRQARKVVVLCAGNDCADPQATEAKVGTAIESLVDWFAEQKGVEILLCEVVPPAWQA